jgi:UDP-glucose 4-epimerase
MARPYVITFMCDIADAHVLALNYLLDNGDTVAVNLGTGHGASVRQVIDTARRIARCEIAARDAPRRAGDPPVLVADPKKAGDVLGWAPQRSDLAAIITDAWRWHNKRFGNKKVS